MVVRLLFLILLTASISYGQTMPRFNLWQVSTASLITTQILDVQSSWQQPEANPIFGDTFTGRDAALKLSLIGVILLTQRYIMHKYPKSKAAGIFSAVNFSLAGVGVAVVARNWSIP